VKKKLPDERKHFMTRRGRPSEPMERKPSSCGFIKSCVLRCKSEPNTITPISERCRGDVRRFVGIYFVSDQLACRHA